MKHTPAKMIFLFRILEESNAEPFQNKSVRRRAGLSVNNRIYSGATWAKCIRQANGEQRAGGKGVFKRLTEGMTFAPRGAYCTEIVTKISPNAGHANEEAVDEAEKRFALFLDHLPSFAWMKDLEGRYVYVNKLLSEMPEYRRGWLGKTDAELWPAEIAAQYSANDQKVITMRQQFQTVEHFFAGGQTRYSLVHKFPIFDQSGAVTMVGGTGLDITDRVRTETQLEEAQHLANLGSWDWDILNNKLIWSNELFHIFGISPAKFAGSDQTFLDRLHPDDRERIKTCITAAIEERAPYNLEMRTKRVRPWCGMRTYCASLSICTVRARRQLGKCFGERQDYSRER